MATRYKTYQMDFGFITIDTQTETAPENYIAGPFDVTDVEAVQIEASAELAVDNDELTVVSTMPDEVAQKIIDDEITLQEWREENPDAIAIGGVS